MNYDILIVGTDREGFHRAITAVQVGFRVAVVSSPDTAPSLDLMRCVASSMAEREEVSFSDWRHEVQQLVRSQTFIEESELGAMGIECHTGRPRFLSPNSVEVVGPRESFVYRGQEIVLATGVKSWCPKSFQRDEKTVLCVESIMKLNQVPQSMIVVGAGKTGLSAAVLMATLGAEVLVVDEGLSSAGLVEFLAAAGAAEESLDISFRLGEEVIGTEILPDLKAAIRLANGRMLTADAVLLCVGKEGRTDGLNLKAAGVGLDERGRVWCDEFGTSWASHISAVGELMAQSRGSGQRTHRLDQNDALLSKGFSAAAERIQASVGGDWS